MTYEFALDGTGGMPLSDPKVFLYNSGDIEIDSDDDGGETAPHGTSPSDNYGWQGSMMAFDIAVLQDKYAANTSFHTGTDGYILPASNSAGSFYSCIWDAGGTDSISHSGSANATIDLRAATLMHETGGSGFVSYVDGIHGGFTIANGVLIENATGGSGNDVITGNQIGNNLTGGGGADQLYGNDGWDKLWGEAGFDKLYGGGHSDKLWGGAGNDRLYGNAGFDRLYGGGNNDRIWGHTGNDRLFGDAGADQLRGGGNIDRLDGGTGNDLLWGNADNDIFIFGDGWGTDTINDFANNGVEKIDFSGNSTVNGMGDLAIVYAGGNATITTADGTIMLTGITNGGLGVSDFDFGGP